MKGAFIAVDWGTTNRRAYRVDEGRVSREERDGRGILAIAAEDFAREAGALRAAMGPAAMDRATLGSAAGQLPLLCVGMVGSRRGWREVPYVATPVGMEELAAASLWVEPGLTAITPGVSHRSAERSDVMRGEEIQFLGAVAAGLAPAGALLCQPGTHSKWARIEAQRIREFSTAMTGEVYALLREHSLLKEAMGGDVSPGAAFDAGVDEGRKQRLLSSLFGARAAHLLNGRPRAEGASYISGLLIASDVQSHLCAGEEVYIIGDVPLAPLYAAAVGRLGGRAHLVDSRAAFLEGAGQLWELLA